jgi:hypothetical protein
MQSGEHKVRPYLKKFRTALTFKTVTGEIDVRL